MLPVPDFSVFSIITLTFFLWKLGFGHLTWSLPTNTPHTCKHSSLPLHPPKTNVSRYSVYISLLWPCKYCSPPIHSLPHRKCKKLHFLSWIALEYNLVPIRLSKIKNLISQSIGRNVAQREFSHSSAVRRNSYIQTVWLWRLFSCLCFPLCKRRLATWLGAFSGFMPEIAWHGAGNVAKTQEILTSISQVSCYMLSFCNCNNVIKYPYSYLCDVRLPTRSKALQGWEPYLLCSHLYP